VPSRLLSNHYTNHLHESDESNESSHPEGNQDWQFERRFTHASSSSWSDLLLVHVCFEYPASFCLSAMTMPVALSEDYLRLKNYTILSARIWNSFAEYEVIIASHYFDWHCHEVLTIRSQMLCIIRRLGASAAVFQLSSLEMRLTLENFSQSSQLLTQISEQPSQSRRSIPKDLIFSLISGV
jgi:hypothetical protein